MDLYIDNWTVTDINKCYIPGTYIHGCKTLLQLFNFSLLICALVIYTWFESQNFYFDPASMSSWNLYQNSHSSENIDSHKNWLYKDEKLQINNYDTGTYTTSDLYISHHHVKTQQ